MPIDLSILNPVWADLLPSSNYTPAVKCQCGVLHNFIQYPSRHFIWFYMPHKIKAFMGSSLLKQVIFSASSPKNISLWSQSLWLLWSIHCWYLMCCLNIKDFEIQKEDRGQCVNWSIVLGFEKCSHSVSQWECHLIIVRNTQSTDFQQGHYKQMEIDSRMSLLYTYRGLAADLV